MKTALFFGSFNPIHHGHTAIAEYVVEHALADELWFVVSPQNPFKDADSLADEHHRVEMARIAVRHNSKFAVCDTELKMPRPSYTIDTLHELSSQYSDRQFVLLIGSDNLDDLPKWKNYRQLISNYDILVYPRGEAKIETESPFCGAPLFDIDATSIRESLKNGVKPDKVDPEVYRYIVQNGLYMDAITFLTASIAFEPENAEMYFKRGKLYHLQGIYDKALSDFLKVLELKPNHREAKVHVDIIQNIFACRFTDMYNP